MASKKHCKRSPSASSRWMNCPGSLKLSEGIPNKESEYAAEGTAAHDVAERALILGCPAKDICDNEEMARAVQVYLDTINEIRSKVQIVVEHTERKLDCAHIEDFGGTSDHMMVYIDDGKIVLHIVDYKHGVGVPVDAAENKQVLSYFVITESQYPGMFDEFRATIIQPRCFEGEAIQSWSCGYDRVKQHLDDIYESMTKDHLAPGSWCRWCPAITICPKLYEQTIEVAQTEFTEIRNNVDELLRLKELEPAIKALLNQIDDAMVDKFRDGSGGIPGYKVVERRSHRRWVASDENIVATQLEGLGLTRDKYIEEKFKTPAQVEKVLPDKNAKKEFKKLAETVVIGYKVVPTKSKDDEVDFSYPEFSDLNE